ncbi:MAG: lipopolysaccharide heptosyltransferase II [Candidatus Omnitrophica bacterium]|nr:lipopolysaccharide heptosyltransferase II [Candidatus Omnitrophota bacterium]
MKKILVVNVNWVGDVAFSAPIFKALKEFYPQCQITCMAPSRVRGVLECLSDVDEIIDYDERVTHRGVLQKLGVILKLRREKFDAAFLLHGSLTRALMVFLAGIPKRIGYDTKKRGFLLTHKISPPTGKMLHRSDYYLGVLESYGIPVKDRSPRLTVGEESLKEVKQILFQNGILDVHPRILVHVGANWTLKRWPKENFTRLLESLLKDADAEIVIPGTKEDLGLIEEICSPLRIKPHILAGKTNLKQLIALMSISDLLISSDSGPLHLANAVGIKTIGLFGPTRPEVTGPKGQGRATILQYEVGCNSKACYHLACMDNICMQAITVKDVLDAASKIQNT